MPPRPLGVGCAALSPERRFPAMHVKRTVSVLLVASGLLAGALFWVPAAHAGAPKCFGQAATIVGTGKSETLRGTSGDDVIVGLLGDDTIKGRGGDDLICGNDRSEERRVGKECRL